MVPIGAARGAGPAHAPPARVARGRGRAASQPKSPLPQAAPLAPLRRRARPAAELTAGGVGLGAARGPHVGRDLGVEEHAHELRDRGAARGAVAELLDLVDRDQVDVQPVRGDERRERARLGLGLGRRGGAAEVYLLAEALVAGELLGDAHGRAAQAPREEGSECGAVF